MRLIKNLLLRVCFNLKGQKISIKAGCNLGKLTKLEGFNVINENTDISDSYIGYASYLGNKCILPKSYIGKFCSIGPEVKIISGMHPVREFISTHPAFYSLRKQSGFTLVNKQKFTENKLIDDKYKVVIGNDVWIGHGVKIMEGVTVGDGAVIGANALVMNDIEPFSINVGIPAKNIGNRFDESDIKLIKLSKWWDKDIQWLRENADKFDSLREFEKIINQGE